MSKAKRTINFRKISFLGLASQKNINFQEMMISALESCQKFPIVRKHNDDSKLGLSLHPDRNAFYDFDGCSCAWISKYNEEDQVQLTGVEGDKIISESVPPVNREGKMRNVSDYSIAFAIKGNYIAYISRIANVDRALEIFINLSILKHIPQVGDLHTIQLNPIVDANVLGRIDLARSIKEVKIHTDGYGMLQPDDAKLQNNAPTSKLMQFAKGSLCGADTLYNNELDLTGVKANLEIKCYKNTQQDTREFVARLATTMMYAEDLNVTILLNDKKKTKITKDKIILKEVIELDKKRIKEKGEDYMLYLRESAKSLTNHLANGTLGQ